MEEKLGYYTKSDLEKATRRILNQFYRNMASQTNPYAAILGGQPGAGKTTIHYMIQEKKDHVCVINGDEFRPFHPHFIELQNKYGDRSVEFTSKFSGEVTKELIEELSNRKCNIVIEGTLRTTNVPISTCNELKKKGYEVDLYVMAVKPEISYEGTINRYEHQLKNIQTPRATAKDHHDMVVNSLADNLSEICRDDIFDNIYICNRQKEILYEKKETPTQDPGRLIKEYHKHWNEEEKDELYKIINQNVQLKKEKTAEDYESYFERVIQIPIYMDKRLVDVKYEVEKAGFKPTNAIISSIEKLNRAFGKIHKVSEIKDMYMNKDSFSREQQDLILGTVEKFKGQEIQQKRDTAAIEFEMNKVL